MSNGSLIVDELSYHIYFYSCLYVWLQEQLSVICHNTWTGVHYSWINTQLSRDSLVSIYFLAWFGCLWVLRQELRTCASRCDYSFHLYHLALLIRHLHIIRKSKNTKYTVDRSATGKTFVLLLDLTLTYGSRTANWTDSLHQTVNGLVGNVDWGESFAIVACDFLGLNTFL